MDKVGQETGVAAWLGGFATRTLRHAKRGPNSSRAANLTGAAGLHVGYRKGKRGGVWVIRRYIGAGDYKVETIAAADDVEDANGIEILDFWQAHRTIASLAW